MLVRISALMLLLTLSVRLPSASARTWTNTQGKQMHGEFVRVLVDQVAAGQEATLLVVLQQGAGVVKVPLTRFSKEDCDYVLEQLEARGEHIWTHINGRLIVAKMTGINDMQVALKTSKQTANVPFGELCWDDQQYVAQWLTKHDQQEFIPQADAKSRLWTNLTGRKIEARFDSVQGQNIHLSSFGVVVPVPFDKLSMADQERLRAELKAEGKENLLPAKPAPPPAVAAAPRPAAGGGGSTPYPNGLASRGGPSFHFYSVCPTCKRQYPSSTLYCPVCTAEARAAQDRRLAQQQAREQANLREAQQRAASINAQRPGAIASGSQYAPLMQGEVRRPSGAYRAGEIAGIATLICMGLALMAYVFRKVVGG